MNRFESRVATAALLMLASGTVAAAELQADRFYVGGGINSNDVDGESATGHQVFAGYELPTRLGRADTAVELGFWDSGDYDVDTPAGERAAGVASYPVASQVDLVGRLGADFGDDDGLLLGGGVGFGLAENMELRGEYVLRDETESLQANFVYGF